MVSEPAAQTAGAHGTANIDVKTGLESGAAKSAHPEMSRL